MIVPTQGNPISEDVQKAIDLRTKALKHRAEGTSENLQAINYYFNNRTPWVRMISSVDTVEQGSKLAEENVLGIINDNNDSRLPSGTEISKDFGVRPKAGITDVQVTSLGRFGALRDITVNFKCFSKDQLDTYEKLFMRPGSSVLIEWGHSLYLAEQGDSIKVHPMGPGYQKMFDGTRKTIRSVYADIKKLRHRYNYEYDAAFGIVKNFSWSFEGAGPTYSCKIIVGSQGEVIGSIDSNLPLPNKLATKYRDQGSYSPGRGVFLSTDNQPIQDFENLGTTATGYDYNILSDVASQYVPFFDSKNDWEISTMLKTFLYQDLYRVYHSNVVSRIRREAFGGRDYIDDSTINLPTFAYLTPIGGTAEGTLIRTLEGVNAPHLTQALGYTADLLTLIFTEEKEQSVDELSDKELEELRANKQIGAYTSYRAMSYLRYGDLLKFLNNMTINDGLDRLVEFDTSAVQLTYQNQHINSIDPRMCLLPVDVATLLKGSTENISFRKGSDYTSVTDIAVNVLSLYEIAENTRGSIKDFLDGIHSEISTATGGFLDLDVFYSEEEALYTIVDRRHFNYPALPEISLLGSNSILRNFNLSTALSNEVASAMAISLGDTTSRDEISKTVLNFHKGVSDRNLPTKEVYPPTIVKDPADGKVSGEYQEAQNKIALVDITMRSLYEYRLFSDSLTNNVVQIFPKYIVENAPKEELGGVILPYTLSMTMDGLSGLLIMDSFAISTNILPSSYINKAKVANLVTGIDTKIDRSGWTSNIKSQYYNIRDKSADIRFKKFTPEALSETQEDFEIFADETTYNTIQFRGKKLYSVETPDQLTQLEVWSKEFMNNSIQPQVIGMLVELANNIKPIHPVTLEEFSDGTPGFGFSIEIYSVFRTLEKQQELYDAWIKRGRTGLPAALPGNSMHNWGGAIDFQIRTTDGKRVLYSSRTREKAWEALGIESIVSKFGFSHGLAYNDPVHIGYNASGEEVYADWKTGKVKDIYGRPITDENGNVINSAATAADATLASGTANAVDRLTAIQTEFFDKPELAVNLRPYNSNPGLALPQYTSNVRQILPQASAPSDLTDIDANVLRINPETGELIF